MNELTDNLEPEAAILNQWFYDNFLVLNGDKSKFITFKSSRSNLEESKIQINGSNIIESKNVKLLGVTLDHQLRLEEHIKVFCKEAGKKVNALYKRIWIASYMDESKRILLMKTFILSYFNYCPLIWMFCSRKSNSRINRIRERAMRIAHFDYESTFEQLLIKNKTIASHKKKLLYLGIEIYKTFNGLNPPFMDEIFSINECPYYLRKSQLKTAEPHYKIYGYNTVYGYNLYKYSRKKSQNLHRLIVLVIFARSTLATWVIFDLYYI